MKSFDKMNKKLRKQAIRRIKKQEKKQKEKARREHLQKMKSDEAYKLNYKKEQAKRKKEKKERKERLERINKQLELKAAKKKAIQEKLKNKPPKTRIMKVKTEVWDNDRWGKGRGGNKKVVVDLSKQEYDQRMKAIAQYNKKAKENNLNIAFDFDKLNKYLNNRGKQSVKEVELDPVVEHNKRVTNATSSLKKSLYSGGYGESTITRLILSRTNEKISNISKFLSEEEIVDLFSSDRYMVRNSFKKFVYQALEYKPDDIFEGRTIKEILEEVGAM